MRGVSPTYALLFGVVAVLLLAGCANLSGEPRIVATILPATAAPPTPTLPPDTGVPQSRPDLASGARIYAAHCAACHGESGRGDGPVAQTEPAMSPGDFTDPASARSQTPHEWFRTITQGRIENLMPPWGNVLTEQERWDVALYTYTLHYDTDQLHVGERVYQDCAECHGPEGRGDGPEAASLEQSPKDLTDSANMVTLSDESIFKMVTQGFEDVMPSYAELSEEERWAVASYARTLSLRNVPALAGSATPPPAAGSTDSLTAITATALLVQVHAAGELLEVVETLRVRNLSETLAFSQDIALPDGTTAALAITLPDDAIITASAGVAGVSADGRTAYVMEPLAPWSEQLYVLAYTMPYSIGEPVSIPLDIVVAGPVRVLVRPLEVRARSDVLPSLGEETLGGVLYNAYGDQLALRAGTELTFTLQGTPDAAPAATTAPTASPDSSGDMQGVIPADILAPLILIAVFVLVGGVAAYAFRTRTVSPEARIMQIAREIGRIDAAHKAGQLNHDLWHRQRAALKAEQMRLRGFPEEDE